MSSRVVKGDLSVPDRRKYVPREVFNAHDEARKIVRSAEAEAAGLVDRARGEAAEIRRKARDRGYATGLAEWEERTLELVAARARLLDESKAELLELSLQIASKILRQRLVDEPHLMLPLVDEAVQTLYERHAQLRLVLHPDDAQAIAARREDLVRRDPRWESVALIRDETLQRGDCRVESEYSQLDVGLETQLRAVRRLLSPEQGEGQGEAQGEESSEEST